MRDVLQSVFGVYTPYTYINELGETIPLDGLSGLDWEYIVGATIFIVLLIASLGIIRTVVKKNG